MKRATIAAALTAGAALLASPLAVAAPEGSADEPVARVQHEGKVVFPEAASGNECTVMPLQPLQVRELSRGGPRIGPPVEPLVPLGFVGALC